MATYNEHCQECIEKLGQPFGPVHKWLDELQPTLGPQHRAIRHNEKGIMKVRRLFGDEAAKAARLHIERDEGGFEKEGPLWKPIKEAP